MSYGQPTWTEDTNTVLSQPIKGKQTPPLLPHTIVSIQTCTDTKVLFKVTVFMGLSLVYSIISTISTMMCPSRALLRFHCLDSPVLQWFICSFNIFSFFWRPCPSHHIVYNLSKLINFIGNKDLRILDIFHGLTVYLQFYYLHLSVYQLSSIEVTWTTFPLSSSSYLA